MEIKTIDDQKADRKAANAAYHLENREKLLAGHSAYYAANKEQIRVRKLAARIAKRTGQVSDKSGSLDPRQKQRCKYGHSMTGDNVRILNDTKRQCAICRDAYNAHEINLRMDQRATRKVWFIAGPFEKDDIDEAPIIITKPPVLVGKATNHVDWLRLHGLKGAFSGGA